MKSLIKIKLIEKLRCAPFFRRLSGSLKGVKRPWSTQQSSRRYTHASLQGAPHRSAGRPHRRDYNLRAALLPLYKENKKEESAFFRLIPLNILKFLLFPFILVMRLNQLIIKTNIKLRSGFLDSGSINRNSKKSSCQLLFLARLFCFAY